MTSQEEFTMFAFRWYFEKPLAAKMS